MRLRDVRSEISDIGRSSPSNFLTVNDSHFEEVFLFRTICWYPSTCYYLPRTGHYESTKSLSMVVRQEKKQERAAQQSEPKPATLSFGLHSAALRYGVRGQSWIPVGLRIVDLLELVGMRDGGWDGKQTISCKPRECKAGPFEEVIAGLQAGAPLSLRGYSKQQRAIFCIGRKKQKAEFWIGNIGDRTSLDQGREKEVGVIITVPLGTVPVSLVMHEVNRNTANSVSVLFPREAQPQPASENVVVRICMHDASGSRVGVLYEGNYLVRSLRFPLLCDDGHCRSATPWIKSRCGGGESKITSRAFAGRGKLQHVSALDLTQSPADAWCCCSHPHRHDAVVGSYMFNYSRRKPGYDDLVIILPLLLEGLTEGAIPTGYKCRKKS
ncbi:hypothetical protein V8F20_009608 [Naviculisporaceae sp. PSN 640]